MRALLLGDKHSRLNPSAEHFTPASNVPAKRQSARNVPDAALTLAPKSALALAWVGERGVLERKITARNSRNRGRVGDTLGTSIGRWHAT